MTASLAGETQHLGAKFEALFEVAVKDVLASDMDRGGPRAEEVFHHLFTLAVEGESPGMLEELLQLAYSNQEPLLRWDPLPNSEILARACKRENYSIIKLLVDRGYRLKPYKMGDCNTTRDRARESRTKTLLRDHS